MQAMSAQQAIGGIEDIMTLKVSHIEDVIMHFRNILPAETATAQAIDQHEPWERIAMKAIDDGYIECAEEFIRFVEVCVRSSG